MRMSSIVPGASVKRTTPKGTWLAAKIIALVCVSFNQLMMYDSYVAMLARHHNAVYPGMWVACVSHAAYITAAWVVIFRSRIVVLALVQIVARRSQGVCVLDAVLALVLFVSALFAWGALDQFVKNYMQAQGPAYVSPFE